MPLGGCGCSNGVAVTALLALLLFPTQYFLPDLSVVDIEDNNNIIIDDNSAVQPLQAHASWLDFTFQIFPPLDIFVTFVFIVMSGAIYFCEWIHRKLMERRMVKLNEYLLVSVARLKEWDAQQDQLESTLKMVQNATSEYNLLLYLLLRQQRCLSAKHGPTNDCFFEKNLEDLTMLRNPVEETYEVFS